VRLASSFAAAGLAGALLEGEPLAGGVRRDGIQHAQQGAQIVKVALRGAAFLEVGGAPLGDELLRCHAGGTIRAGPGRRQCFAVDFPVSPTSAPALR